MTLVAFIIGLFVGWNFIPQPAFIKTWYDKIKAWIVS